MPIYEYNCQSCNKKFDQLVRSMTAEEGKVKCPACGSARTARMMSVFAVASESGKPTMPPGGGCGRCGGPGPCAMD